MITEKSLFLGRDGRMRKKMAIKIKRAWVG